MIQRTGILILTDIDTARRLPFENLSLGVRRIRISRSIGRAVVFFLKFDDGIQKHFGSLSDDQRSIKLIKAGGPSAEAYSRFPKKEEAAAA
jgi:hypothetical protein